MDKSLKPRIAFQRRHGENNDSNSIDEDRLSSLPIELLIYLLSFLPTKDAAAMCILSRRLCCLFPLLTSLDFDATHIHHCSKYPSGTQHFPSFVAFVNAVLCVSLSQHLTKFRLRVDTEFFTWGRRNCNSYSGHINCFPDLKSSQVNAWISFPLTRCGLTELDIRIWIKEPCGAELPREIFTCESLEVLKLNVNLGFPLVSTFRLPNLKLCHLHAFDFSKEDFFTRLVSSCPLLADFSLKAYVNHVHCASISSPSLRRLNLKFYILVEGNCADVVLINTPNLEYLYYSDNLALQYSVQNMPGLVNAVVSIHKTFFPPFEVHHQQVFNLIRPLSNVQDLSLLTSCPKALHFGDVKDCKLPFFPNLKCLQLGFDGNSYWDRVVLPFLNCSPVLETLVFPQGLDFSPNPLTRYLHRRPLLELEEKFSKATQTIVPQCCRAHLKRIVIKSFYGSEREVYLIQFLLRKACVLEELVVDRELRHSFPIPDKMSVDSTLKMLPRASQICSIQVN